MGAQFDYWEMKKAASFSEQDIIGFTLILGFCTVLLIVKASSAFRENLAQNPSEVDLVAEGRETSNHGRSTTSTTVEQVQRSTTPPNNNVQAVHDPARTVLIVDDDPVTRMQLRKHLEKLNFRVNEVADGPAAVQLYKEGVRFCMVVMDYEMPDMNGLLATKKIRGYDNDVVIVGSTIHDPATKQDEFLQAGANFVDIKPISAERLSEFVAEYNLTPDKS